MKKAVYLIFLILTFSFGFYLGIKKGAAFVLKSPVRQVKMVTETAVEIPQNIILKAVSVPTNIVLGVGKEVKGFIGGLFGVSEAKASQKGGKK